LHTKVNEAIRPKFLDLKEGAIVVSLKPFVSSLNARVTERNVGIISLAVTFFLNAHRSTTLVRYLMSLHDHTTLVVFHGVVEAVPIICIGWTGRDTLLSGNDLRTQE
jgi:hypothetical protein